MTTLLRSSMMLLAILFAGSISAADIIVTDDGSGTGTTTWTNDNTYFLDGFVFVNSGQVLTIEAGTVIKGIAGTGADASALVVARGGQIFANGTAEAPIIFTFEGDPLDGSIPYDTRGQWGGLIILGAAELNSEPGETQIEGIPETEERGLYGGNNNEDNSGVLNYISVRHGGTDIGAGNEINGITFGGVGSGTTIDYVEVVSNSDDGIEFFGGTAQIKHALVAFCGDDSFDYDEGWRGKGQFWVTIHDPSDGDRGGEHDGGTNPEDGAPFATPEIYNATYMGRGTNAGKRALTFRDNAGGKYYNSIFYNWGRGVDIENLPSGQDSYQRFEDGELVISNSCFFNVVEAEATAADLFKISMGSGWASEDDSTAALNASTEAFLNSFASNGNVVANPQLNYQIEQGSEMLIVKPQTNVDADPATDEWFTSAAYKGAFDPSEECTWLHGWSFLDERMFLGCNTSVENIEYASAEPLSVFPNPSNGLFNVTFTVKVDFAMLSILDMTGRIVETTSLQNLPAGAQVEVNLDQFGSGLYLVQFEQNGMVKTARVIVR